MRNGLKTGIMTTDQEVGLADVVADQDHLGWESYFKAIAEFIMTCRTPMTMAIQGDWGVGKSTAINLIEKEIKNSEERIKHTNDSGSQFPIVKFNTWQYSKVEQDTSLYLELLWQLTRKVSEYDNDKDDQEKNKLFEIWNSSCRLIKGVGKAAVDVGVSYLEAQNGDWVKEARDAVRDKMQGENETLLQKEDLETLKAKLSQNITRIVNGGRLIVFIDDLDRLEPRAAIELLEALKVFLDLPDCVFVLAMDKEVVYQGIRSKYGDDFQEEKGRKFFDKIIQVPFDLPVWQFDIHAYMRHLLEEDNYALPRDERAKDEVITRYATAVKYLGDRNPRAIKRFMNLLALYKILFNTELGKGDNELCDDLFYVFVYLLYEKKMDNSAETAVNRRNREALADLISVNSVEELMEVLVGNTELSAALGVAIDEEGGGVISQEEGNITKLRSFLKIIRLFARISNHTKDESIMDFEELDQSLRNIYKLEPIEEKSDSSRKWFAYMWNGRKILKLSQVQIHSEEGGKDSYNVVIYTNKGVDLDDIITQITEDYYYERYIYNNKEGQRPHATLIQPGASLVQEVILEQYVRLCVSGEGK